MAVLPVSLLPVFNFFYKNNKSELLTNRSKVRIILFWWSIADSNRISSLITTRIIYVYPVI